MADLRYITVAEIKNQIPARLQGMLANDTPGDNDPDQATPEAIIKQNALAAEATFESYVGGRYDLPIKAADETVSELIKSAIFTITKYKLYARRDALSPAVQEQYRDVLSWLMDVAKGRANIITLDASGDIEDDGESPIVEVGATDTGDVNSQFNRMP